MFKSQLWSGLSHVPGDEVLSNKFKLHVTSRHKTRQPGYATLNSRCERDQMFSASFCEGDFVVSCPLIDNSSVLGNFPHCFENLITKIDWIFLRYCISRRLVTKRRN